MKIILFILLMLPVGIVAKQQHRKPAKKIVRKKVVKKKAINHVTRPMLAPLHNVVYIIPPAGYENEKLFDLADKWYNRDDCMRPYTQLRDDLRAIGYDLKTTKTAQEVPLNALIITSGIPTDQQVLKNLAKRNKKYVIGFTWEPPAMEPHTYSRANLNLFSKLYTLDHARVDNQVYFKHYYVYPTPYMIPDVVPFEQKFFLTLVAGYKANAGQGFDGAVGRHEAVAYFEQNHPREFLFYGKWWKPEEHPCFGGSPETKVDVLKQFKFCICYENTCYVPGYITEKINDCFHAGCVPVYWGAPDITEHIPANCFIDKRNFASYQELYQFLKAITPEQYDAYLDNIRNHFASEQGAKFSPAYFSKQVIDTVYSLR